MTTPKIYDFADLGPALKRLEDSKPGKAADVPAAPVNHYPAPDWANIHGAATAPVDYLGYMDWAIREGPMAADILATGGTVYAQHADGRAAAWGWPDEVL